MKKMMKVITLSSLSLTAANVWAASEQGEELHDEKCSSCHMMESHEALYTRENRIVDSLHRLGGQVSACTQALNIDWFPEDEKEVVNYLNEKYYRFKK